MFHRFLGHLYRATCFICAIAIYAQASTEVEATGRASAEKPNARAIALSDALREAVREGAGINLVSESKVTDFTLEYDRTFSKAFGHLKKYKVLKTGIDEEGFYFVTIKAEVGEGDPSMDDTLTLQMLAREKGAPRLVFHIREEISGVTASGLALDWMRATAAQYGLRVIDEDRALNGSTISARRAGLLGRKHEQAMRSEGIVSTCDYIVEGKVVGRMVGSVSYYGSKPAKKFSLGLNIRVVDAATGAIVATANPPSRDIVVRSVESDEAAAREAVRNLMEGGAQSQETDDAGRMLFRRLFSHWCTEMDLGCNYTMEFTNMCLETACGLKEKLSSESSVGAINIRSIDTAGISVIECEARMKAHELAAVVEKHLPTCAMERAENRYLAFRIELQNAQERSEKQTTEKETSNRSVLTLAACGLVALLMLVLFLVIFFKCKQPIKS